MDKYIVDGKVAVLYSPGYGAGWYSWHHRLELVFDPAIVLMVLNNQRNLIEKYVEDKYGDDMYLGGADQLEVYWLPVGTQFRVDEYDGSESLMFRNGDDWITA
jgi:hypothetical protein